ncbi:histamine H2 receptor-like [Hydractinia symbiolongicarpus]|uniref:histamine H2 receptor-like n=1 Tax=Hydractinia symbiolongicarpus TaxID=13093 RepID=UPI00254E78CF|nr:histamine H2 receptor-like [Hydractinia symbiolongicarpus]XP_057298315.1 histamine H2 receptor-like [Hydractinia symbiolongicarpus]
MCLNETGALSKSIDVFSLSTVHFNIYGAMLATLAVAIIFANILLLCSLANQKRSRTNIMFIILGVSDLLVGLVTLPLKSSDSFMNQFLIKKEMIRTMAFFDIGPLAFSWGMTIIISAERCVVVTHQRLHERFGKVFFNNLIVLAFLTALSLSLYKMSLGYGLLNRDIDCDRLKEIPIWYTMQTVIEFVLSSTAGSLQLYLLYHIKKKFRALGNHRHSVSDHGGRVTKSIRLLFVCLVGCYVPHTVTYTMRQFKLIHFTSGVHDFYFDRIPIYFVYLNSLLNSLILLSRSTNIKRQREQLVKTIRSMIRSVTSKL